MIVTRAYTYQVDGLDLLFELKMEALLKNKSTNCHLFHLNLREKTARDEDRQFCFVRKKENMFC
jgi:hypothetical protein